MASVNKVILVGNLGKDPEVRTFENSSDPNRPIKKATFSLATSETIKRDGQKTESTEWHNIVMWRGLAEIAEKYLRKGQSVYIEGKIKTRSYEKDGQKRYITEIEADNMTMLGGKKDSDTAGPDNTESYSPPETTSPIEDDLPF